MGIRNLTYRNLMIVIRRIQAKGYSFDESEKIARNIFSEYNPNGLSIEEMTKRVLTKDEFEKEWVTGMYAIRIKEDGNVEMIDYVGGLNWFYRMISCDYIEIVRSRALGPDYAMVLDENGKLTLRSVNAAATALYGDPVDFIVGTVVIVKENEESDFIGMTAQEAQDVIDKINAVCGGKEK